MKKKEKLAKKGSPITMELRSKALTWSSLATQTQKMAVPKNVIVAMEALEKKLTESMDLQEKKLTAAMEAQELRMTDRMEAMFEKVMQRMDKMTYELKESFSADVKAMTVEIESIKNEMTEQNKNLKKVELKSVETEKVLQRMEIEMKENEERFLKMECHSTQLQLRLRGIPETVKIEKQVIQKMLAEYLDKEITEISYQIDSVYRINSEYARLNKLPRDTMIHFVTHSIKEDLLKTQFEKPLEIDGEKVKIMREIPRKVMLLRKDYKKLKDKLNSLNIRFRWEIPQGMTFEHKGKKHIIRNIRQMEQCLAEWTD